MSSSIRTLMMITTVVLLLVQAAWRSPSVSAPEMDGSQRVLFLLERLESAPDYKVRIAAANALGKMADGTLGDWMVRAFRREQNSSVRLATLYSIGQIPDHRIISPLIELFHQELLADEELLAVERIIWNLRSAIVIHAWTTAMIESPDRSERGMAAWLLGVVGDASLLPALGAATHDSAPNVRTRAVLAIARIGAPQGRAICQRLGTKDPEPTVRKAARNCSAVLELVARGTLSPKTSQRVGFKADLSELRKSSVTPDSYRAYRKKNVNPRVEEAVVAQMRPNEAEVREDKTIRLVDSERMRQTFRLEASLITAYRFQSPDLKRLREVVREGAGSVNQCYVEGLRSDRKLAGSVTVRFRVIQNGSVGEAVMEEASLPSEEVRKCILLKVREFTFPSIPLEFVTMRYTYSFTPPKDEKFDFNAR